MLFGQGQAVGVNVDGDNGSTERRRQLHPETADSTNSDEHGDVVSRKVGTPNGFQRCGDGVSHDRKSCQVDAFREGFRYCTETPRRNQNVGGESTMPVVSGHELLAADGGLLRFARWTVITRDDRGNDDGPAHPAGRSLACRSDASRDLVTQDKRQWVTSGNAVDGETDIGMADSASRHLHDHLVVTGDEWR
jgi:hypothetical protein